MRLGLIGYPLAHSVSPAMHRAALQAAGLEGIYRLLETPPDELESRVMEVRRGYRGVNVTVPHKVAVLPYLDEVSPEVQAIGAVNTIVNEEGRLVGHNTDAPGFTRALEAAGVTARGLRAVVLGAGGAARAVVYALVQAGARVRVANRTFARAKALAEVFGAEAVPFEGPEFVRAVREADLLVNATSVGLNDPGASPIPEGVWPREAVVDIVYNPLETRLLREARAAGLVAVDGLGMLVWQGALAFELWTGRQAPVAAMHAAARAALGEDA
ncbi:shikimate dehydrogenase [Marinithermus hydrothermalis]|uniref:Shikimate dehydrogenase (NADP(+)) n=1 Tax=Marinithermus hydrothermalis (strain DSM 14884 / JCM 11576 / T1) TaxID=869210 RepID=F2NP73_MARHT|nr:shikimate dehydrogenase [Marinithermus hydrothermalis]AEB11874.1 Shikimate dehydrogenase [Marinithermus hydrothermalis DSM 14884]